MTVKADLTGQRFGQWLALEPTEGPTRNTYWHCRCDCGVEAAVATHHLRSGRSWRCRECGFRASGDSRRADRTGKRFGRLVAVERTPGTEIYDRWTCLCDCGATKIVSGYALNRGNTRSCGCLVKENNRKRRGTGKPRLDSGGYEVINAPDHPSASKYGTIRVHRMVMEEILGRPLLPGENVHHKNGVRNDNRPENLELWVKHQPAGQRAQDLLAWAREIEARYEGVFEE